MKSGKRLAVWFAGGGAKTVYDEGGKHEQPRTVYVCVHLLCDMRKITKNNNRVL